MPRNLRPFWVEVDVTGRKGVVGLGPKFRGEHTTVQIFADVDGESKKILQINLFGTGVDYDTLQLQVVSPTGEVAYAWQHPQYSLQLICEDCEEEFDNASHLAFHRSIHHKVRSHDDV